MTTQVPLLSLMLLLVGFALFLVGILSKDTSIKMFGMMSGGVIFMIVSFSSFDGLTRLSGVLIGMLMAAGGAFE